MYLRLSTLFVLFLLFALPAFAAGEYGVGTYGSGTFGFGTPAPSPSPSSIGGGGGGGGGGGDCSFGYTRKNGLCVRDEVKTTEPKEPEIQAVEPVQEVQQQEEQEPLEIITAEETVDDNQITGAVTGGGTNSWIGLGVLGALLLVSFGWYWFKRR